MASYIDFRYPGAFNLNQQATLPKIAVPDVSQMFQTGLSAIADPIAARLREDTTRARTALEAADNMKKWDEIYRIQAGANQGQTATPAAPTPRTGSPAGDDSGGAQGGGVGARPMASSAVRDTFMETVKAGGLTNPYGLAAVAATGERETGWSPGRVSTSWDDLGKPSGGTLSWRDDRLRNMRQSTAGAEDPVAAQAQFLLKENPTLIANLNRAESPEEANRLMANAWRYRGYNRTDSDEYAKREALTRQYVSNFAKPDEAPAPAPQTAFAPEVSPDVTPAQAPMNAATGRPMAPNDPALQTPEYDRVHGAAQAQTPAPEIPVRRVPTTRERAVEVEEPPAPQAAAPAPVQVASLDPRISPAVPGLTLTDAVPLPPRRPPELTPAPQAPPTSAVPPSSASGAPQAAPAATRPPASPAGVPPEAPVRVAQAQPQGLPAQVSDASPRIDPRAAALMLRTARTPEEVNKIGQALLNTLLPPEAKKRFDFSSDGKGNAWIVDTFTGKTTPLTGAAPALDEKKTTLERNLFNDFEGTQTVKDYRNLEQGVQGLRAAFTEGSATADQLAIIQVFKALDPTSTVTGGESANFKNAAGVPEQLRSLWNRGIGEGGTFSPELRAQIFNTVQRIQQNRQTQVEQQAGVYRGRARRYGLDEENVVSIQPFKFERATPQTFPDQPGGQVEGGGGAVRGVVSTPGSSQANPIDVPNEAAASRLPKGTFFRLNGRIGVNE